MRLNVAASIRQNKGTLAAIFTFPVRTLNDIISNALISFIRIASHFASIRRCISLWPVKKVIQRRSILRFTVFNYLVLFQNPNMTNHWTRTGLLKVGDMQT